MHAKHFFENFWPTEQKNEIFVCMPFDDSFDYKFEVFKKVGEQFGLEAKRTKEGWIANDIVHEILDGIGSAKILLFDVSPDPKTLHSNENVLYELGIADAIREPEDLLLIRKKTNKISPPKFLKNLYKKNDAKVPFDISHIRYHEYEGKLSEAWLKERISAILENQKWYKSKLVKKTAQSIDSVGFEWILNYYPTKRKEDDHFNDQILGDDPKFKLAFLRLIDLGIIWLATERNSDGGHGYAYHWTPFGREVIKYLGIEKHV